MKFYPVNLNLKDKKVLIVGAGTVALRKFQRLLLTESKIKIVSPEFNQGFKIFFKKKSEQYNFFKRKFREKDLNGYFLVFAATDNSELNQKITFLAKKKNILVNTIDDSGLSDFTVPSAVNRGDLLLTVSTGSSLPALSKNIRKKLESDFEIEYGLLLDVMSEKRMEIINNIEDSELRKIIFRKIASDEFLDKIREIIIFYNLENLDNSNNQFESLEYQAVKKEVKIAISKLIERKKSQNEKN